jgi:hypothetical protein
MAATPTDILYRVSPFGDDGQGPKTIRAATLEKLVQVLTDPETPEHPTHFLNMVVLCHRLYTSSKHFIDLVIQRFNPEDINAEGQWNARQSVRVNKPLRLLRLSLPVLLERNPRGKAVDRIEQFADGILEKAEPGPLRNAAQTLKMFIASSRGAPLDKAQQSQTLDALRWELDASPSQQLPQEQLYPDCVELESMEEILAEDVAKELTLMQSETSARLQPLELLWWFKARLNFRDVLLRSDGKPEAKARMERKMANVVQLLDQFSGIVHWVRKEIDDAGQVGWSNKTSILRYFFVMSKHLRELRNLNTLAAVMVALHPHFGDMREILAEEEIETLREMMQLYQSSSSLNGEADILSTHLQLSLSTKQYRDVDEQSAGRIVPFVALTLANLQLLSGINLYVDETEGPNLISLRIMESIDLVIRDLTQTYTSFSFLSLKPVRRFLDRRLKMGHNLMRTQPLKHLCRVVVWQNAINYRNRVPHDLIDYLGQHMGASDILTVISSL